MNEQTPTRNVVVAITGASGSVYGVRLIEALRAAGCDVDLSISAAGGEVIGEELGLKVDLDRFEPGRLKLDARRPGAIRYHHHADFTAPIASGSFPTQGMVVCPCSSGTLGSLVHGISANLIHRAAEVHLKEHRRLILVPRETPLSLVQLQNMHEAARAGAVVLPASPGFYHGPATIDDLVDFIVARILDQLDIDNELIERWGSGGESDEQPTNGQ